jgi:choline dehydrogenase
MERKVEDSADEYEFIVVGSGAGGGPLAANLAKGGYRVMLIEAGSDSCTLLYQVPCFHALASEEKAMSWDYFVHHYDQDEQRDSKYVPGKGIFYPRAGTLGGCSAHNAMITVVPHDSDWNSIAALTGDASWRAEEMHKYFARLEKCTYIPQPAAGKPNPTGHGFSGWLSVSTMDPRTALGDLQLVETVIEAMAEAETTVLGGCGRIIRRIIGWMLGLVEMGYDPNDARVGARDEGMTAMPLATAEGRRNGPRDYVLRVKKEQPDRLTIALNTLAARVIFDDDHRAVAVECLEGAHLFSADPSAAKGVVTGNRTYRCSREIILCGGAFNTPQLLMLSGVGPKAHLEEKGIRCRVDRPGVGRNLQDRYEVAVVSKMDRDFEILDAATFRPPSDGEAGDACFQQWKEGKGVYTTNGAVAAVILRSKKERDDPDLFIFGLPGAFSGYFPGYSETIERSKDFFTWAILKAHTANRGGEVRLASSDPRVAADIHFHYFEEGSAPDSDDLESVVNGILFAREMNRRAAAIHEELVPGREVRSRQEIGKWVRDNAWGHHASCSCRMGVPDDPMAVVDSRFRVIGTKGLRVVDASVFPRVPGFFIVTPIYMISEKASDVIIEDATHQG